MSTPVTIEDINRLFPSSQELDNQTMTDLERTVDKTCKAVLQALFKRRSLTIKKLLN